MAEAGYVFDVVPPTAEESRDTSDGLSELVEHNALRKARWVSGRHPDAIVIGADTLVCIDGEALGKPEDMDEAAEMIGRLSGRTHKVYTGVALCCASVEEAAAFHVITRVTFKELGAGQIAAYFDKVNPLDKAGAYGAQEHGDDVIECIDGSWSNVVGLPMDQLNVQFEVFQKRTEVAR
jgi:septum formation protein